MFPEEKKLNEETEMAETNEITPETDQSELETARAEAADWREKYLRQLAEFDNFRKRTKQESAATREWVAESIIMSLLPVLDDFNRMLAAPATEGDEAMRRGVELIRNKLQSFFDSYDVKEMEARGKPFDPSEHDALLMSPTKDFPAGIVLDVITPGYRMKDRVIRHAQVVVSTEPEAGAEA